MRRAAVLSLVLSGAALAGARALAVPPQPEAHAAQTRESGPPGRVVDAHPVVVARGLQARVNMIYLNRKLVDEDKLHRAILTDVMRKGLSQSEHDDRVLEIMNEGREGSDRLTREDLRQYRSQGSGAMTLRMAERVTNDDGDYSGTKADFNGLAEKLMPEKKEKLWKQNMSKIQDEIEESFDKGPDASIQRSPTYKWGGDFWDEKGDFKLENREARHVRDKDMNQAIVDATNEIGNRDPERNMKKILRNLLQKNYIGVRDIDIMDWNNLN